MTNLQSRIDDLLLRAGSGEAAAVEQLFDLHRKRLGRMVAVRMDPRLRSRVDASDIVQESLAEAFRKFDAYLLERPLPFYPWLRQITSNRMIDEFRKHVRAQTRAVGREQANPQLSSGSAVELVDRLAGAINTPSEQLSRKEAVSRLQEVLYKLAESDRELIVMRHLEQLSTREVAAVLGISEAAVKTRLVRALQRIRQQLERFADSSRDG